MTDEQKARNWDELMTKIRLGFIQSVGEIAEFHKSKRTDLYAWCEKEGILQMKEETRAYERTVCATTGKEYYLVPVGDK